MVKDAVEAGADIIMLDNMSTELLKQCIDYIDGRAEIEVSGNVTKENIARIKGLQRAGPDTAAFSGGKTVKEHRTFHK